MIITWKVSPTNVGESVSAKMTLCEVAMYSFFHLQRFSVHHYASPCQWPPSQSSEWQYSPSWSSVRATIIVRVAMVIIMIISESDNHLHRATIIVRVTIVIIMIIFRVTIIARVTMVILMIISEATWPSPGGCPWSCWWPRCWPSWRSQARARTEQ